MELDERIAQELIETRQRLLSEGKLPSRDKLAQYYATFRDRFGPERLRSLDGEALLNYMHAHSNRDSLVYWLEFKNDEEFPHGFGSIAGGSALKFGIFQSAQSGEWITGSPQNQQILTVDQAIEIASKHRVQLLRGLELLDELPANGTDEDYRTLQERMDAEAPDVSRLAWGHKYFSLIHPDKLDDYHVEIFSRFNLVKLVQVPPEGNGRYLCAGRYVAIGHQLGMPVNHLTTTLNTRNGKPHKYWRILANYQRDAQRRHWETMQDEQCVAIEWPKLGDLSGMEYNQASKDRIRALMKEHYSDKGQWPREVFTFVAGIAEGDIVMASEKNTVLGIGKVTGPYYYEPSSPVPHRLPVQWLSLDRWEFPFDEFSRYSPVVREVKQHINQVEAERQILNAGPIVMPSPPPPQSLEGIPARIQAILERKGQVILYGPPGTGKTYWAERAARDLAASSVYGQPFEALTTEQQANITRCYVRMCAFHPSYGYEDFLQGYRPDLVNDQLAFVRRDGIFKQLCDEARREPQHKFYLIVDEINRGDVPRIFGELLTVLEKDKRGKPVMLSLDETPFTVPANVYLIGTMNTADRSIALLDTALRRRFGFIELMPDYDVLDASTVNGIPLGPWLRGLNQRILEHVGRDARNLQIGHAYLLHDGQPIASFSKFRRVLEEDIVPLLQEYCYEDYRTLGEILGSGLVDVDQQVIRHELFSPDRESDLITALLGLDPELSTLVQATDTEAELSEDEEGDAEDAEDE